MAKAKRIKNKDNARRSKKKISILNTDRVDYIDYKDVNLLRKFMSERAKVRARRVTGNDAQQQREVARAIKNAREMALLPYANRVAQQRGGRNRDRDREDSELSARDAGVTEADERRRREESEAAEAAAAAEGTDVETTETDDLAEVES
jgi:small subunit ribosomal protein S18